MGGLTNLDLLNAKTWLWLGLSLCLFSISSLNLNAQNLDSAKLEAPDSQAKLQLLNSKLQALYPYTAFETKAFKTLDKGWSYEGTSYKVGQLFFDRSKLVLNCEFQLDTLIGDSLYLYFEGLAWVAELEINEKYLGLNQDPFLPWVIPLSMTYLNEGRNFLKLRLSTGTVSPLYPKAFLGIFRPALLLKKEELAALLLPAMERKATADTLAIIAPVYGERDYGFNVKRAAFYLSPILENDISSVFFPFNPSREMEAFCKQFGLQRVMEVGGHTSYIWINAYDKIGSQLGLRGNAWLDSKARRTASFGEFLTVTESSKKKIAVKQRFFLLLLSFIPLFCLMFIQFFAPSFLKVSRAALRRPFLAINSFFEFSLARPGILAVLLILKILMLASCLTMFFYIVQGTDAWGKVNLLKDWSLSSLLFYGESDLYLIFGKSLTVLLIVLAWDLILGFMVALGLKVESFLPQILGFEILGSYPLILIMNVPLLLAILVNGIWRESLVWIFAFIFLLYMFQKAILIWIGLGKRLSLPTPIKILYICAAIILPSILWF